MGNEVKIVGWDAATSTTPGGSLDQRATLMLEDTRGKTCRVVIGYDGFVAARSARPLVARWVGGMLELSNGQVVGVSLEGAEVLV